MGFLIKAAFWLMIIVQKAQFGARMLMDLINGRSEDGGDGTQGSETEALFEPASFDLGESQDTLNPEDREEAWSGPDPAGT